MQHRLSPSACAAFVQPFIPIQDLRHRQARRVLWSAQLLTLALWGGAAALLGAPLARVMPRLALASAIGLPLLVLPGRRQSQLRLAPLADPERRTVAQAFGQDESDLFRARHARRCTVHHDGAGSIVALQLPEPPLARLQPDRDAHPVG